ncbi:hypothetical protein HMPREF1348_01464 [Enterococcus faecium 505]|uniref:Uncharacterized protein n=1 Tax=Enterococcus faecium 505 TaxID=1134806 RepID=J6Y6B3_ENTFC|nr:hypothetical protein HMPREF1348_01464 [Enterococcus faecium 505]
MLYSRNYSLIASKILKITALSSHEFILHSKNDLSLFLLIDFSGKMIVPIP